MFFVSKDCGVVMRWIFLLFLLLFAFVGNFFVFEHFSLLRMALGVATNMGMVALLLIWQAAYFLSGVQRARRQVVGHAWIMLAIAIVVIAVGADIVLHNSCEYLLTDVKENSLKNQLLGYVLSGGYCAELGVVMIGLGIFIGWPSLRLFYRLIASGDKVF
ncbi:hypothetical protein [Rheinheimera sp.]|uniref:hypothetical protein n=1 Tax=Rheinheimera sp. TaxID=1869214 RepID=UPI002FDE6DA6